MLAQMRNDALREVVDAYPRTLVSAYRIASQWTNEELAKPAAGTDQAFVTATKDTDKKPGKPGKSKRKVVDPLTIHCYVCGDVGHYARECTLRKSPTDRVNVTKSDDVNVDDQEDEWGNDTHLSHKTTCACSQNTMCCWTTKLH